MDKYLVVKGCAGLGNRMFTLAAAIAYAEQSDRLIAVDWSDGVFAEPGKNAFEELFSLDHSCSLNAIETKKGSLTFYPKSLKDNLRSSLYQVYCASSSSLLKKIPGVGRLQGKLSRLNEYWHFTPGTNFGRLVRSDLKSVGSLFSSYDVEYGHKLSPDHSENVVMYADYWPGDVDKLYFDKIKICPSLLTQVQQVKDKLGWSADTLGVHIRFSDKKPTRELNSLLDDPFLRNAPSVFLATDNLDIEALFKKQLGHRVLTQSKYYPDDTFNMHHAALKSGDYSHALQLFTESMVDVLLLGQCGTYYYQGNSSFSKLALKFAGADQNAKDWLTL